MSSLEQYNDVGHILRGSITWRRIKVNWSKSSYLWGIAKMSNKDSDI